MSERKSPDSDKPTSESATPTPQPDTSPPAPTAPDQPQPIVIQQPRPAGIFRSWTTRLLLAALVASVLLNFGLYARYRGYFAGVSPPLERFHSGDRTATAKIAVVDVSGTIMPPFTERILRAIERAEGDDNVKGVVLVIDSPGGLVADSHQIYRRLQELKEKKPILVAMKRMAASGGYYIAMGAGAESRIYAEPTTWTGSIGVIIPRYDATELSQKLGVKAVPLKTGEFKDALSPFRELSEAERELWREIMDDSFHRFLDVIAGNRKNLDHAAVEKLATGQIYTAGQAQANGLIDGIGYEDEVIDELQTELELEKVRVVTYQHRRSLLEMLTESVEARRPEAEWSALLDATVPRPMYLCSWGIGGPVGSR